MRSFGELALSVSSKNMRSLYGIIAEKERRYIGDSKFTKPINLSSADINSIKSLMYDEQRAAYVKDGVHFVSAAEAAAEATSYIAGMAKYVKDGYYNPYSGAGVRGIDPGTFNMAFTPVSMSPNEATSYYASGGLPKIIIDKKARGPFINGYNFEADFMPDVDKRKLKAYAQSIGFDAAIEAGGRDALIYGGAIVYPHFKKDDSDTYCLPLNQLADDGVIDKDCIDYFVIADRWNCITVPNYDITARDYLTPSTLFIPIGGIRIATSRCAMLKPNKLPYWGALRNLGWSTSDFEGYIRQILAYRVAIQTIPIMAQQMSILVHEIPLDAQMAMLGKDGVKDFIDQNNEELRKASMFNPLTMNSFGELKAINRSFTDWDKLIEALRMDIGASSGFPESTLFHNQPTGFSDNVEDITLKQSETIKGVANAILPSLQPLVKLLVFSCFGKDSEYATKCDQVRLTIDSTTVLTNEERANSFQKFAQGVSQLAGAGAEVSDAVNVALSFMSDVKIPEETLVNIKAAKKPEPKLPPEFLNKDGNQETKGEQVPEEGAEK